MIVRKQQPLPLFALKDGSQLPLQEKVVRETEPRPATAASSVPRRKQIPDRNRDTLPTAIQPKLTDKRRLRCEKLEHHLHAPNDFVEVVLTELRIRFAEIGPGMDVVDHQFEVVAVDVVIQAAGDGMNTVVAHLPGV
jgi:hypothetical protein